MTEWTGAVPQHDDFGAVIRTEFIDGRTKRNPWAIGPWAIMSPAAHEAYGVGLGLGKGQKYVLTAGRWVKQ